ncbi:hypothetical protein GCM10027569_91460 [Flindersiella endophytica]
MGAEEPQQLFYAMATQAEQHVRNGEHGQALQLFARIVAGGDPEFGPHAALRVGALLADSDPEAAAASWRFAADHGAGEIASAAASNLQLLAQHTGRPARTEPSSIAEVYGRAAVGRGRMLLSAGDMQAADQAFEEAVGCPHPDVAAEARVHLGTSRAMQGDADSALSALNQVVESGHSHWAPLAAIDVAELLWDRGETARAVELLRWSASTNHPTARTSALSRLAALGESPAAEPAFAGTGGDGTADSPQGLQGQPTFQYSSDSNAAEAAGYTDDPGGSDESDRSDDSAGTDDFEDIGGMVLGESAPDASSDDSDRIGAEAVRTGRRLLGQGDLTSALRWFEQAVDTGHPIHAPIGAAHVAHAFSQREGMAGAETGIARLADSGHGELAGRGWFFLGRQLVAGGTFDEAEEALQKAADLPGNAQPAATCSLWVLDADLSNAEETFGETLDRTPDLAGEVVGLAVDFGDVLRRQNDPQSRTAYELAFHLAQRTGDEVLVADVRKLLTG